MMLDRSTMRKMMAALKNNQGRTLDELTPFLPDYYRFSDYDPRYYVFESVMALIQWGLVEAFVDGQLLESATVAGFSRWDWPQDVTLYVTKQALEMESVLGIRLDGGHQAFFDELQTPQAAWPDVFVLMPFDVTLKPVYEDHIRTVVTGIGMSVGRADDFFTSGTIVAEIWTAINRASILIADCTGRNPNVFYEIGIAHTLGKQTILIAQSIDDIPFDLRHRRVITYRYDPRGMKEFEDILQKTIQTLRQQDGRSQSAEGE
ncbi:MAG: hypothetical protein K8J31_27850 [Anaerolineae bacterium]|nr:hypothetical protein [Anaerolineae bacterium]